MNKTKRGLELGSAITSIVVNSIACIIFLLATILSASMGDLFFVLLGEYEEGLTEAVYLIVAVFIVIAAIGVTNIVLAAKLCTKPKINAYGCYEKRLGISIAHIVLNAIMLLIFIEVPLYSVPYLAIVVLGIISVCKKHPEPQIVSNSTPSADDRISELNRMKSAGFITENDYEIALNRIKENEERIKKRSDLTARLTELKKCRDMELITEEQYIESVNKLLEKTYEDKND